MGNMIEELEGYRKQVKRLRNLKDYDILAKVVDDVLPIAKQTLIRLEKGGQGDTPLAKAYRRFVKECEVGL